MKPWVPLMVFILTSWCSLPNLDGAPVAEASQPAPQASAVHGQSSRIPADFEQRAAGVSLNQMLMVHVGTGGVEEVKQDLDRGAEVNFRDPISGLTPLMVAEAPEVTALLLARGADVKAADVDGATVLHYAVLAPRALELLPLLLRHGAEINRAAAGRGGETPLFAACQWFFEGRDRSLGAKVFTLLAQKGADLNTADHLGNTLLMVAAMNRKPDMMRLLLTLGADPRLKNGEGLTALDYARSLKFEEIEHLLQAADPR